jgi:uncharacterized heparinase superfamily protein
MTLLERIAALALDGPAGRLWLDRAPPVDIVAPAPDVREGSVERGRAIIERVEQGYVTDWDAASGDEARSEAHGFDWLRDLRAVGDAEAEQCAAKLFTDWYDRPDGDRHFPARPAITARRLYNLLRSPSLFRDTAAQTLLHRQIARDLQRLAVWSRLPLGPANGFAVGHALIAASASLARQRRLASRGEMLVLDRLDSLAMPDGSSPDRTPRSTFLLLEDLVQIRLCLRAGGGKIGTPLGAAIDRTAAAVRSMRHPDGDFIGFRGASGLSTHRIGRLLSASRTPAQPVGILRQCGIARMARDDLFLFMGGAGAGTLPIEFSADARRIFVTRQANRRSGLVAPALKATYDAMLAHDGTEAGQVLTGEIEGGGQRHERTIFLPVKGSEIRGEDRVSGSGESAIRIEFHLAPGCDIARTSDGASLILRPGERRAGWRFRFRGAEAEVIEIPDPDSGRRAATIVLSAQGGGAQTVVNWGLRRIEG